MLFRVGMNRFTGPTCHLLYVDWPIFRSPSLNVQGSFYSKDNVTEASQNLASCGIFENFVQLLRRQRLSAKLINIHFVNLGPTLHHAQPAFGLLRE